MQLGTLDHINVRTAHLDAMRQWYTEVLGMTDGRRPNFPFGGAWLYANDRPCVHLVEVERQPKTTEPRLEHFAFAAKGLSDFIATLEARSIPYQTASVPDVEILQVNLFDPDGNHIHVDFSRDEAEPLGL